MDLIGGASKCLGEDVSNLLLSADWHQGEHLGIVEFADEMLLELKVLVPAADLC